MKVCITTKIIITFFFLLELYTKTYGQVDSNTTIIDTVIINAAPVLIKKTIYLNENITPKKNDWYFQMEFCGGKSIFKKSINNANIPIYNARSMSISIGKKIHQLSIEIGVGILSTVSKTSYQDSFLTQGFKNTQINETYIQNGIITNTFQTINKTEKYYYLKDSVVFQKTPLAYFQIPFSISQTIKINKFNLIPFIGLKPSFLISARSDYPEQLQKYLNPFILYYNIGFKISIILHHHLTVISNFNYQLASHKKPKNTINNFDFQNIGIGLNYNF